MEDEGEVVTCCQEHFPKSFAGKGTARSVEGEESLEEFLCLLLMLFLIAVLEHFGSEGRAMAKEKVEDRRGGITGGRWLQRSQGGAGVVGQGGKWLPVVDWRKNP